MKRIVKPVNPQTKVSTKPLSIVPPIPQNRINECKDSIDVWKRDC